MNTYSGKATCEDVLVRGRTAHAWLKRPVDERLLRDAYDMAKWGATAVNACPMRVVFASSAEAKERLIPCLHPENAVQTIEAPVTAIIGYDTRFYELIPRLMPAKAEMIKVFEGLEQQVTHEMALRNSSLQGAYFMLAARSLGLDCGPMSGFNHDRLNAEFFPDKRSKANFLCNLGYGDYGRHGVRGPRLEFDEVCRIV